MEMEICLTPVRHANNRDSLKSSLDKLGTSQSRPHPLTQVAVDPCGPGLK